MVQRIVKPMKVGEGMAPGERFELPRDFSQWFSRPPQYRTMRPWLLPYPDKLALNIHGKYYSSFVIRVIWNGK